MMKRFLIIVLMLLPLSLAAEERSSASLYFSTVVPEDWGVPYPENALRLDDLVFEVVGTEADGDLIERNGLYDLPFEEGENSLTLDLLYYGNKAEIYRFELVAPENIGWLGDSSSFDVDIEFVEWVGNDGIVSRCPYEDRSSLVVEIPPTGSRYGDKVGSIIISWSERDIKPGEYELRVDLSIRSML